MKSSIANEAPLHIELVSDQRITCNLSLNLLKRLQLTSSVTIYTKCDLSRLANQLIEHSTAQKQHFLKYSAIIHWKWLTRKPISLSCLTLSSALYIIDHKLDIIDQYPIGNLRCWWNSLKKIHIISLSNLATRRAQELKYKLNELFHRRNSWSQKHCSNPALALGCSPSTLPTYSRSKKPKAMHMTTKFIFYSNPFLSRIRLTSPLPLRIVWQNWVGWFPTCYWWITASLNSWL